jgi:glycosyltransferase involved in cell wall biosynthesis
VLDLHGRIPEEYAHLNRGRPISYRILNQLEARVVRGADHIVVVSQKLKDYLVSTYAISAQKLTVIPMCADGQTFRWDRELRLKQRAALGFKDRFVCVHLGSFFVWYDPELIVRAFERIRKHTPSAHLLVLTGDLARVKDYLTARVPEEAFTVMSVPHADVPHLLLSSDLGFLLLRSTPNIIVSSPAKFSEYLNAGTPVLITPAVGDFSELTAKTGSGMVASEEAVFDVSIVDDILRSREEFASRCTKAGQQLTWQAHQAEWTRIVGSLLD